MHIFPFEKHHVLDSDERHRHQPPGRLLSLVLAGAPHVLVDLGAGTGYFAIPLARKLPGGLVIAIDADPRMLGLIRRRASKDHLASRIETIAAVAGVTALPLSAGSADAAFSVSLFHELPHPAGAIKDLVRVLRPGGRLLLCDWDPEGDPALGGPPPAHRVPASQAAEALRRAGCITIERRHVYEGMWTFSAITGADRAPAGHQS